MEKNTPKAHSAVNIINRVRMVFISSAGSASARDDVPIYIPTTRVITAMLVVCPIDLIVASIDVATP